MMPLESHRESVADRGTVRIAKLIEAAEGLGRRGQHDVATVLFQVAMAADAGTDAELAFAESLCRREEFEAASEHLLRVFSKLRVEQAPDQIAAVCNNLAVCYRGLGEFERAAAWQQQSIRCEQREGARPVDPRRVACDLTNCACDAVARGDFLLAESLLRQSLSIEHRCGTLAGQAADRGNLGIVAMLTGRHAQARRLLWQAYCLHRRLDDAYGCACDLFHLAELWNVVGHADREIACLERAVVLLRSLEAGESSRRIQVRLEACRRTAG